jgi:hypothetical protein
LIVAAISIGLVSSSRGTKFGVRNSSGKKMQRAGLRGGRAAALEGDDLHEAAVDDGPQRDHQDQHHEAGHAALDVDVEQEGDEDHHRAQHRGLAELGVEAAPSRATSGRSAWPAACRSSRPRSPRRGRARRLPNEAASRSDTGSWKAA